MWVGGAFTDPADACSHDATPAHALLSLTEKLLSRVFTHLWEELGLGGGACALTCEAISGQNHSCRLNMG